MLLFGLITVFGGVALIAWLVFKLATYAFAALAAISASRVLHAAGVEWLVAVPSGIVAVF